MLEKKKIQKVCGRNDFRYFKQFSEKYFLANQFNYNFVAVCAMEEISFRRNRTIL